MHFNNFPLISSKSLNFLIFLFPFSFILGNPFINIEVILISVLGLLLYKNEILNLKKDIIINFIIFFFILIIISTLVDIYQDPQNKNLLKSILYLRYCILLLVLGCAVKKENINFKLLFLSCFICSTFVSLDVILQFIIGKNLLGFTSNGLHNSSVFGEELIAGSFIQRFGILGIFFAAIIFKQGSKHFFTLLLYFTIIIIGTVFSGNRMPVLLMLLLIFLGTILVKEIRFSLFLSFFLSLAIISITLKNVNLGYEEYYKSFYRNGMKLLADVKDELKRGNYSELDKDIDESKKYSAEYRVDFLGKKYETISMRTGHSVIYVMAFDTWLDNPIIGSGIKSFRVKCLTKLHLPNRMCASHTHNYYLEILNDSGVVGALLLILAISYLLIKKFRNHLNFKIKYDSNNLMFYAIFLSLIIELFPLKSSGNFFSTYNSSFIFFLIGLLLNIDHTFKKIKN
mgnify:CR=1 FL=1